MMRQTLRRAALAIGLFGLAACAGVPEPDPTIYLVRHAEKQADSPDPGLTPAGEARALALAERLSEAGLAAIYSSPYRRTRDTAAPVAARTGLSVTEYDPRALDVLAGRLREEGLTALVVGHSNTTPELAAALGAEPGAPIREADEYDRIYVIRLRPDGGADSRIERYGAAPLP